MNSHALTCHHIQDKQQVRKMLLNLAERSISQLHDLVCFVFCRFLLEKKQFCQSNREFLICNILQTLCKHYFHNVSELVLVQELILLIIVVMITI